MSTDPKHIHLSNQARWYLTGRWPVESNPAIGNKKPEETAMQELVDKGLATVTKTYYLTALGRKIRNDPH